MVHTGPGKASPPPPSALRCARWARLEGVGVVQFGKGAWQSGERLMLESSAKYQNSWHTLGRGLHLGDAGSRPRRGGGAPGMGQGARTDGGPEVRLLVLDELNISLRYEHLPLDEVLAALQARRADLHVVVTGRNAKPELIAAADLVTEMTLVKHHFAAGVKAQEGIEFRATYETGGGKQTLGSNDIERPKRPCSDRV